MGGILAAPASRTSASFFTQTFEKVRNRVSSKMPSPHHLPFFVSSEIHHLLVLIIIFLNKEVRVTS